MRISDKQVYTFTYNLIYLMMGRENGELNEEMTQEQLAQKLGVAQSTVSSWIRTEKFPRESTLIKIAELFGVTVDELLNVDLNYADKENNPDYDEEVIKEIKENDPYIEWREMRIQRDEAIDMLKRVKPIAEHYLKLNIKGQKKVQEYTRDIAENPKYRKDNNGNSET